MLLPWEHSWPMLGLDGKQALLVDLVAPWPAPQPMGRNLPVARDHLVTSLGLVSVVPVAVIGLRQGKDSGVGHLPWVELVGRVLRTH